MRSVFQRFATHSSSSSSVVARSHSTLAAVSRSSLLPRSILPSSSSSSFHAPLLSTSNFARAWQQQQQVRLISSQPSVQQSVMSSDLLPIDRRLESLEAKIHESTLRSHASLQDALAEVQRMRAQLEEETKKLADMRATMGSSYATSLIFLVYLFFVTTWMTFLITDLTGHVHGIPVVRMVRMKPIGDSAHSDAALQTNIVIEPADPADMRDVDTQGIQPLPSMDEHTKNSK